MKRHIMRFSLYLALCFAAALALTKACSAAEPQAAKVVTFGVCEDYDKGQDLKDIAQDFELLRQLEIDTMRVSFGWDDYEPASGKYDFDWLHQFANLAAQYGIKLRPYLCYAAPWAGNGRWNSPPNDYRDWYWYCYRVAEALKDHPNIVSYEMWNEEDLMGAEGWWGGTIDQYMEILRKGSLAVRAADPGKQILLGGFARPRTNWLQQITEAGYGCYYDVTPFHCYAETWWRRDMTLEDWIGNWYYELFLPYNEMGGGQPIWVNEIGYSTLNRSEEQQADFLARAVAYFFSAPGIEHICWYEIRDLNPKVNPIGDNHNYHLGITTFPDRKPKLAFYTLDMLSDLLDGKSVVPAADEAVVTVTSGAAGKLHKYLFKLADGSQLLFIYDKQSDCTVDITLPAAGKTCQRYALDGTSEAYAGFSGSAISGLQLTAGKTVILQIVP
jgi:hypothetical protein